MSYLSNEAFEAAGLTARLAAALAASAMLHALLATSLGSLVEPGWSETSAARPAAPIRAAIQTNEIPPPPGAAPKQDTNRRGLPRPPRYYSPRELDVKPGIMTRIHPEYPETAAQRSLAGKVRVRLFIDESGAVERVLTLRADPPGYFEQSVEQAFSAARFTPGVRDGRAVKVQLTLEVNFDSPPRLPVRDRRIVN